MAHAKCPVIVQDDRSIPVVRVFSPLSTERLAVGAANVQSSAIASEVVRIVASAACHIAVGLNPTAGSLTERLPADVVEYIYVPQNQKVAVRQVSGGSTGYLYITSVLTS